MLQPVILCGGDGTRLWPASRKALPKQFMPLGDSTLFKDTLKRALNIPGALPPLIICNETHRFQAAAQAEQAGAKPGRYTILLEPEGRNTAPAIALAALHCQQADPVLLILPSDHVMDEGAVFAEAIAQGFAAAEGGKMVTFGIIPNGPETGYGYIEVGEQLPGAARRVARFVEKPDLEQAREYVSSGKYLWNSGMFMFKASVFLQELEKHNLGMLTCVAGAFARKKVDFDFTRIGHDEFVSCLAGSIDYTIMEYTDKAAVVAFNGRWSDLGSWQKLHEAGSPDSDGNVISGDVLALDCRGCYLRSEHRKVAALGLEGLIVAETADAILVAPLERSQEVRRVVSALRNDSKKIVDENRIMYRPWGHYEALTEGNRFLVKRIIVAPGQSLSLQKHYHRAEHWVVVRGTALVFVDEQIVLIGEDQSTYIPLGKVHRLENPGKIPLEIIEIQTGSYLGEDDIERFDDKYGRHS